jgi:hypothetical protein
VRKDSIGVVNLVVESIDKRLEFGLGFLLQREGVAAVSKRMSAAGGVGLRRFVNRDGFVFVWQRYEVVHCLLYCALGLTYGRNQDQQASEKH